MRNEKERFPLDIQFFADSKDPVDDPPADEQEEEQQTDVQDKEQNHDEQAEEQQTSGGGKEPSVQDLMVELAKLKKAQEKAATEAATYKKKYNEKLSEKERVDAEKAEREAEREEEFQQLLRENKINKLEKYYLGELKYTPDEASKMAIAEVDDDFDAKLQIQLAVDKRKKKEYETEFVKNNPRINAGVGGSEEEDAFLKGFNSIENKFVHRKKGDK